MKRWLPLSLTLLTAAAATLSSMAAAQTSPAPHMSATRYDIARRVVGRIAPDPDALGSIRFTAIRNTYDTRGRLTKVEFGELTNWQSELTAPSDWTDFAVFRSVEITYDELGRKLRDIIKFGVTVEQVTQYSYNAMGELDCTAVRMNPSALPSSLPSACTPIAEPAQGSFGPDRITRNIYNATTGRLDQVRRAVGTTIEQAYVSYTHTANGQVATVTDANGGAARYAYDGHDRLSRWVHPSPTTAGVANEADYEQYSYDPSGNRLTLRKRDGGVLSYSYDALSRMVSKTVPDCVPVNTACPLTASQTRDIFYRYDNRGLQRAVRFDSHGGPGLVTVYDGAGRAESSTSSLVTPAWVIGYQWNRNGVRTRVTHPDGAYFTYEPDGLNRIVAIRENGSTLLADYVFNARGEMITSARGGASSSAQYDSLSRPSSVTHDLASSGADLTTAYSYNPASQIVIRSRSNDAYIYTGDVDAARTYSVNGLNQYLTVGSSNLGYDPNGNLTSDGSASYTYDRENRLIAATGAKTASLSYDPLGRLFRVSDTVTTTTRFLYDGDELIGEYVGGVLTRRYVHGASVDDPIVIYEGATVGASNRRQLFADHQGSIVATTDATGVLLTGTSPNRYDDWGTPDAANSGRFQFTGQAWIAELGLYHYKARFYSPALGRFLQTDPIGYQDQQNLYAYVGNDPLNFGDPDGLEKCPDNDLNCVETPESENEDTPPPPESDEEQQTADIVVNGQPVDVDFEGDNEVALVIINGELVDRQPTAEGTRNCPNGPPVRYMVFGVKAGEIPVHSHGDDIEQHPGPRDDIASRQSSSGVSGVFTRTRAFTVRRFSDGRYRAIQRSGPPLSDAEEAALTGNMQRWENPPPPPAAGESRTSASQICPS